MHRPPSLERGSAHPTSVLSGSVASYLIYADVRFHIPMTHRNDRYVSTLHPPRPPPFSVPNVVHLFSRSFVSPRLFNALRIKFGISQSTPEQCRDMCLLAPDTPCGAWSFICDGACQNLDFAVGACFIYAHPTKAGFPWEGDPGYIAASGSCTGSDPLTTPSRTCTDPRDFSGVAYFQDSCTMENRKQVGHFPGTVQCVKSPRQNKISTGSILLQ